MTGLTASQDRLLKYIAAYIAANGFSPSVADMMGHMGYRSRGALQRVVDGLVERGALLRLRGQARSLRVVNRLLSETEVAALTAAELSTLAERVGAEMDKRGMP